jgi:hypothetical protein
MNARILNSIRFLLILLSFLGSLYGQERPLITQSPDVLEPGKVSFQFGFDFLQDVKYPASGLRGDQTSLGVMGIYIGLGEIVEFEMNWTAYNILSISQRTPTPLNLELNSSGTSTSDYGDLVLSTKILMFSEGKKRPSIAFLPGVQLPNASAAKGIGLDSTQFYGSLLFGKHLGKLNLFSNVGIGILSNPIEAGVQNDVLLYGLAGIYPITSKISFATEVAGRWNTRQDGAPLGTESLSQFRAGIQVQAVGLKWDIAGIAGLTENSPRSGIVIGVSKDFQAFRKPPKKR